MIDYKHVSNKVVCVGKNYAAHAKEMNTAVPTEPLLFLKPWSSVVNIEDEIVIPAEHGEVHHELEIAFVIDEVLENASERAVQRAICGIGLALDFRLNHTNRVA